MPYKKSYGSEGELLAEKYLQNKGYKIVAKNYSCKFGEIDIIAEKGGALAFIEVKTRSSAAHGKGYEAVDTRKQSKIIKTAEWYIATNSVQKPCRFDVISIDSGIAEHIENAFTL